MQSPAACSESQPATRRSESARRPGESAYLSDLGERVRQERERKGLARKVAARLAGVSERHLANLELGHGNVSILVLRQVARALGCRAGELIAEPDSRAVPARERDGAHTSLTFLARGHGGSAAGRSERIAMKGPRSAGKSTFGSLLAGDLGYVFIELSDEIERIAGCSMGDVVNLYGMSGCRRYERLALDEVIRVHQRFVVAFPSAQGIDTLTGDPPGAACFTIWLQATAEDHLRRAVAQGRVLPRASHAQSMADIRQTLDDCAGERESADLVIDTSDQSLVATFRSLREEVRQAGGLPL